MRLKSGLLIFLLLPHWVFAQEFEQFFEEFDVVLYQMQVNVLDRDGFPIKGLKKGDFTITLDGKVQEIQTVEEFELESMVARSDREAEKIPEQARRLFVFFFDLRYSTKRGVLQSQEAATDFVQTEMLPTDLAGVFTYHQLRGVSMVTNFTNDSNHLLKAIGTLGLDSGRNVLPGPSGYYLEGLLQDSLAINGFDQNGNLTNSPGNNQQGAGDAASQHLEEMFRNAQVSERRNYDREVQGFLASMEKFGEGLRYIRGRKNLLWFSTGFDSSSLVGVSMQELRRNAQNAMFGEIERVSSDQFGRGDIQSQATRSVEALQSSGTVVFAMDTSMVDEATNDKTGLHTLNFFAEDTGGKVYTNTNHFDEPLQDVKHITNHYYLVSFYPESGSKRKKQVGRLKVKVNKPRAKIHTNKGMLLDPDFKGMSQIEKNIQISEYIARDQVVRGMPLSAGYAEMPSSDSRFVKLHMGVEIRGDYFLAPGMKGKARDVEIYAMAIDKASNQVFDQSHFQFTVDPTRLKDVLDDTGLKYFANLFVKPGDYKIKVVARDLENGKIGSWIENATVGDKTQSLAGPYVISDDRWVVVQQPEEMERRQKAGDLDFSYPFQVGKQRLIPSSSPVVANDKTARFFYILNYRESQGNQTVPQIQAMFMDKDGKYIMIPPSAVQAQTELREAKPHLTMVSLSIDLTQVSLKEGENYKLMAYFGLEGQPPLKSMQEITVASL